MHHGLPAVHDDPLAIGLPFHARLGKARLAQRIEHAGGQCLGLPVGGARGHDDPLKQRREVLGVKHRDVLSLHIFEPVDDGALESLGVFFGGGFCGHQAVR